MQENVAGVQENSVRVHSFWKRVQECRRSGKAFGLGINENPLIYRDLGVDGQK